MSPSPRCRLTTAQRVGDHPSFPWLVSGGWTLTPSCLSPSPRSLVLNPSLWSLSLLQFYSRKSASFTLGPIECRPSEEPPLIPPCLPLVLCPLICWSCPCRQSPCREKFPLKWAEEGPASLPGVLHTPRQPLLSTRGAFRSERIQCPWPGQVGVLAGLCWAPQETEAWRTTPKQLLKGAAGLGLPLAAFAS